MYITDIRKTPLYERHTAIGANIVDFHGWLMPIHYKKGIVEEHLAVRRSAGIFDVSHMGEIEVKGRDAYVFLQGVVTNNLDKLSPGGALYTPMCSRQGGIIDDLIVHMFSADNMLLVVNASNTEKDYAWIRASAEKYDVKINDISEETASLAVQGPLSCNILREFFGRDTSGIKRFRFEVIGDITAVRTGYTGEDGFELYIKRNDAVSVWDRLISIGSEPCGLGARDTLRMEKGYILYGNDADNETTPFEAGIGWTVDLNKEYFLGKDALLKNSPRKILVRMEMQDKAVPRRGCVLSYKGRKTGQVTSGTYSPSLRRGIAMGYVRPEDAGADNLDVEIRGRVYRAVVRR